MEARVRARPGLASGSSVAKCPHACARSISPSRTLAARGSPGASRQGHGLQGAGSQGRLEADSHRRPLRRRPGRRVHRTVRAGSETQAYRELAAFVAEVRSGPPVDRRDDRAVPHLVGDKGREPRTVGDYRRLHAKWFSPQIGSRRVRDVDDATAASCCGPPSRRPILALRKFTSSEGPPAPSRSPPSSGPDRAATAHATPGKIAVAMTPVHHCHGATGKTA
jgi:hypothetical protein